MSKKLFCVGLFSMFFIAGNAQKTPKGPAIFGFPVDMALVEEANGHIKCASYEHEQHQRRLYPQLGTTQDFENWLAPKVEQYKKSLNSSAAMAVNETLITIPVVVHVVHNNKSYGVAENIKDEQIFSQIAVLNEDFRRAVGTAGYNSSNIGADINVEFCLASRTPDGDETNGIVRHNRATPANGYDTDSVDAMKPSMQWDPNSYLNIWVVDQMLVYSGNTPVGEILGYAQFPTASGLQGLDGLGLPTGAFTDGVVIGHRHFGSYAKYTQGTYASSNTRGRTATHEVGHYLGLRHIYGDSSSCSVDDYCPDTPNATSHLQSCSYRATCGVEEMKENYMNYTPETCQNIFTLDQKARIRTVLANSPRRASLLNSLGCTAPVQYGFDARIKISNLGNDCSTAISPVVLLENKGTQTAITSAVISYGVGNNLTTYTWTGNLSAGAQTNVTLPQIILSSGTSNFVANIVSVNGTNDENLNNNSVSQFVSKSGTNFTSNIVTLTINPDQYPDEITWDLKDSYGLTLYQGGSYNNSTGQITSTFNLIQGECYTFTIYDEYEDGICCQYGNGNFSLTSGGVTNNYSGNYSASSSVTFGIQNTASLDSPILSSLRLYPNPTNGIVNLSVNDSEIPESFVIYNTIGQVVKKGDIISSSDLTIDASDLSNGVYLIKVEKDGNSKTLRFVKR